MSEPIFKPGQLVRLRDPATLTPTPGEETGDQEFWELIQDIPLYYLEEATVVYGDASTTDFPHRAIVVGVFKDVLIARHNYEQYANYSLPKGTEEWHFRDGELEAIPDEQ